MPAAAIALLAIALVICLAALAYIFDLPLIPGRGRRSDFSGQMKNIVFTQRKADAKPGPRKASLHDIAAESRVKKTLDSRLTLEKKLKYAQWAISPKLYYLIGAAISLTAFFVARIYFDTVIQMAALFLTGPLLAGFLLMRAVESRFKAFDKDYPQFLLSLVGLIKTGMQTMPALEAAAQGLEESSLVREEITLMIERLRFGVPEEKSIGAFGEDIYHPEIELFVQAILLSRRVGGNLSDTLERLARQVRRRQVFREQAVNAVGLQRGSIYFIIVILVGMELYLYISFPQAVTGALNDEIGWQIWQGALILIALGLFWVRQVTKIRI